MEYKIPEIENPKEIVESMKKFKPYFIKAAEGMEKGLRFGDGGIKLGELPRNILLPCQLFSWICRTNEVIENLNIILHDLELLRRKPHYLPGSQRVRYFLLLRIFFYEFFRVKEISNFYLERLKELGVMEHEDFSKIKSYIYKLFKKTLKIRNGLVHKDTSPSGTNLEFHNVFSIYESGFKIVDKKTGVERKWEDSLNNACESSLNILFNEGKRMSEIMQAAFSFWNKTMTNMV